MRAYIIYTIFYLLYLSPAQASLGDELANYVKVKHDDVTLVGDQELSSPFAEYQKQQESLLPEHRFFSLSSGIEPYGALYDETKPQNYYESMLGIVIQKAHHIAKDWYLEGDDQNYSYTAFLLGSIAVFMHESRFMHQRIAYDSDCDLTRQAQANSDKLFKYYFDQTQAIFPVCPQIDEEPFAQIMVSANGQDFGIAQLNIPSHPYVLMPENFFDPSKQIEQGLRLYYRSFHFLNQYYKFYKNQGKEGFQCQLGHNPFLKKPNKKDYSSDEEYQLALRNWRPLIYYNLIHAAWSGGYNQGYKAEDSNFCRYASLGSKDSNFRLDLDKIIWNYDQNIFNLYMDRDSVEYLALMEILNNFRKMYLQADTKETWSMLQFLLHKQYINTNRGLIPGWEQEHLNAIVTSENGLNLRSETNLDQSSICGTIMPTRVHLVRHAEPEEIQNDEYDWVRLQLTPLQKTRLRNPHFEREACAENEFWAAYQKGLLESLNQKKSFRRHCRKLKVSSALVHAQPYRDLIVYQFNKDHLDQGVIFEVVDLIRNSRGESYYKIPIKAWNDRFDFAYISPRSLETQEVECR